MEEATEFARKQAMMYIETSAKNRAGIRQAFEELVRRPRRARGMWLCGVSLPSSRRAHATHTRVTRMYAPKALAL